MATAQEFLTALDLITVGRCSVDLYGQQIGGRLEDVASFAKSVGGSPANIAIGTARLGLKSALISRVGDEPMGRFIREQMIREGVETAGLITDPKRLTALVLLGVESEQRFPLIFYRDNCADSALCEADIDPAFIASAKALLVTGTHFANELNDRAQRKAMAIAKAHHRPIIIDIDYRPNLWGLAGHGAGEERYIRSDRVSAHLQTILPACDLIVGTEEELHIAAGTEDTLEALRIVRQLSSGIIVLKRGPMGCVIYPGDIPASLSEGIVGQGFPIEVYNVLGAGDAFLSGFLRGWLKGEELATCATYANACGAFAVSRLLCSPESPSWPELQYFLEKGSPHKALRHDEVLNHLHWATTRPAMPEALLVLALERPVEGTREDEAAQLAAFNFLAVQAVTRMQGEGVSLGVLLDQHNRAALSAAQQAMIWTASPVEVPNSSPLTFQTGAALLETLNEWPTSRVISCELLFHPDDPPELMEQQLSQLKLVYETARLLHHDLWLSVRLRTDKPVTERTTAQSLALIYQAGIKPDWWGLEQALNASALHETAETIRYYDLYCRGLFVHAGAVPEGAPPHSLIKGLVVSVDIFGRIQENWRHHQLNDEEALQLMADCLQQFIQNWPLQSIFQAEVTKS